MNTLNDSEEQELLDGIKVAIDLVEGGMSPNAALAKVARDAGHGPGKIRLLGYAYNTGRQTAQREMNKTALEKLATFTLVDPEAVVGLVYPEKQAETVHPDYLAPPSWVRTDRDREIKQARDRALPTIESPVYAPDPDRAMNAAVSTINRVKRASVEADRVAALAEDALRYKIASLIGYFKEQFPQNRLPFPVVDKAAQDYFGGDTAALMNLVHTQGKLAERFQEKRAGDEYTVLKAPLDLKAAPFPLIQECLKLASETKQVQQAATVARQKAASIEEEQLRPFTPAGVAPKAVTIEPFDLTAVKTAGLFTTPAMGAMMGSMVTKGLGGMPETKDDMIENAWLKLEDPQHANTLRKIRAHAMINGLMTDPDDPISGYDPDTVLAAYNDLAKLAPRTAEQPAAMGPLLRRRLSGQFEPFESKEIVDLEKSMAGTKANTPNTGKLSNAPDKLRG